MYGFATDFWDTPDKNNLLKHEPYNLFEAWEQKKNILRLKSLFLEIINTFNPNYKQEVAPLFDYYWMSTIFYFISSPHCVTNNFNKSIDKRDGSKNKSCSRAVLEVP